MNRQQATGNRQAIDTGTAVFAVIVMTFAGCSSHFVNPWRDELSSQENPSLAAEMVTPSVAAARAAQTTPTVLQRPFEPDCLEPVDNQVTHGPLYFEDRHESPYYDDGQFAWRTMDYWYMVYGPARWMANGLLMPVSVIATPPWVLMESDGCVETRAFGEKHDARRAAANGPDTGNKE